MNREQAEEILEYLLTAAHELDEARAAAAVVEDQDEQDEDAAFVGALATQLNSELIAAIFQRFTDLVPFEVFPAISSSLRWDQVRLPASVSEADIDAILFSVMKPQWRKVAAVVGRAFQRCEELGLPIGAEALAARLEVLSDSARIEGVGDLRKWGHSEVRLKD